MPDSNIRDSLLAHLTLSRGDIDKLRNGVASWFDQAMDRVGGVYKRKLKVISILVGLGLAIVINADSVAVATALWHDPTMRAQASDAVSKLVATQSLTAGKERSIQELAEQVRPLPIGWGQIDQEWSKLDALGCVWFCVKKVLGIALTGIALSLGAPFWFDLLSKFMNVRGSGVKPERTPAT
jgi:hypothetical protein